MKPKADCRLAPSALVRLRECARLRRDPNWRAGRTSCRREAFVTSALAGLRLKAACLQPARSVVSLTTGTLAVTAARTSIVGISGFCRRGVHKISGRLAGVGAGKRRRGNSLNARRLVAADPSVGGRILQGVDVKTVPPLDDFLAFELEDSHNHQASDFRAVGMLEPVKPRKQGGGSRGGVCGRLRKRISIQL